MTMTRKKFFASIGAAIGGSAVNAEELPSGSLIAVTVNERLHRSRADVITKQLTDIGKPYGVKFLLFDSGTRLKRLR